MVKNALIITWEKFQDHELIYPFYSLKEAGFNVTLMANKKLNIIFCRFCSTQSHCKFNICELLVSEGACC